MTEPIDEELAQLKERSWRQTAAIDAAYARGELDDHGWHRAMAGLVVPAYLSGDNPRAQSGHSGDEARWEGARRLVLDAVDGDGTFLDIGCANGHLMDSVQRWAAEDSIRLEPWGVDIAPELVALARRRLPQWADRISVANAADWRPARRFDYARTSLDYVPAPRRRAYVEHLLTHVIPPSGRLIVGVFYEEVDDAATEAAVGSWGFRIAGASTRAHPDTALLVRRVFWVDGERR